MGIIDLVHKTNIALPSRFWQCLIKYRTGYGSVRKPVWGRGIIPWADVAQEVVREIQLCPAGEPR